MPSKYILNYGESNPSKYLLKLSRLVFINCYVSYNLYIFQFFTFIFSILFPDVFLFVVCVQSSVFSRIVLHLKFSFLIQVTNNESELICQSSIVSRTRKEREHKNVSPPNQWQKEVTFSYQRLVSIWAIVLSHYDATIKTFIKILLFNARDHGHDQRKLTENRSKNRINSR